MPSTPLLSLAEYQEIMARPKSLVQEMAWTGKHGKIETGWVFARMGVSFDDGAEYPERFYVQCQWRAGRNDIPDHWTFNLLYRDERVYAIHVQPTSEHPNRTGGKGRPLYGETIPGIHEHTWSQDGGGYAEPISVPTDRPDIVWKMFLKRANINGCDFFHPDENQPELKW